MKIGLPAQLVKNLAQSSEDDRLLQFARFRSKDEATDLDLSELSEEIIDAIRKEVEKMPDEAPLKKSAKQSLATWDNIAKDPTGAKCRHLKNLASVLRKRIEICPHKWLFQEEDDGRMVPLFVSKIEYQPYDARQEREASVSLKLLAYSHNTNPATTIQFASHEVAGGKTADQLLQSKGFYAETAGLIRDYEQAALRYQTIREKTGELFLASGIGFDMSDRYCSRNFFLEKDGEKTRCVMDDVYVEETNRRDRPATCTSSSYWTGRGESEQQVVLPIHPYVKVFDLRRHEFLVVHVANLTEYVYDPNLADKLVLSEDKKEFVEMLVGSAGENYEDIVKGKSGGTIVLATGDAGIGKTLTAECYSERVKRALYAVQCSQLGIDEVALEKNLLQVLARATRWKAVLLIDEADVYIHERGEDLQQNAVVGVFLRVLEYFKGLLFMTSNRDTIIDDAIISRVTAHIRYDRHKKEELREIWEVLSEQTHLKLTQGIIAKLVEEFPNAAGRNVKSLLKLGVIMHAKRPTRDLIEMFKFAGQFVDMAKPNKEEQAHAARN